MTDCENNPGPVQREIAAARILQRLTLTHFRLSCLEARRTRNPARTRYAWRLSGGVIYVWLPAALSGPRRRMWLEENIGEVDPGAPGERRRVQAVIDELLGPRVHVPIHDRQAFDRRQPEEVLIQQEVGAAGLARAVAREKADRIDQQRPAIRALGEARVERLVLAAFDALGDDTYQENRIAGAFGLSPATLSRFAGSRWKGRSGGDIPDLWRNTAQVLAGHPDFIEAAEQAGVWPQVRQAAQGRGRSRREGTLDG